MDYNLFVLKWWSQLDTPIDQSQETLRAYISASASFLILDSTHKVSPETGLAQWVLGFNRIMDLVASIHATSLEYETVACISRALSECWCTSDTLDTAGKEYTQDHIKIITARLRKLLDDPDSPNPTFKNQRIHLNFM
ncbi:hypothetical protein M408DRAFT_221200 [Serendipita vermifera MAFF 305830]|uniref:Uncharacterized protein n=1 Tax=Serendipita vermifera MAFF 305830 TaxID=933852 RepID=A0A0C3B105_SERVB|nr:hypothetical protein M408DRAFT_221200 [Serendipita vermifera MAFF 305830]